MIKVDKCCLIGSCPLTGRENMSDAENAAKHPVVKWESDNK